MSTASKLTLLGTTAGAIGIVIMVHYQQQAEKAVRPAHRFEIWRVSDRL